MVHLLLAAVDRRCYGSDRSRAADHALTEAGRFTKLVLAMPHTPLNGARPGGFPRRCIIDSFGSTDTCARSAPSLRSGTSLAKGRVALRSDLLGEAARCDQNSVRRRYRDGGFARTMIRGRLSSGLQNRKERDP